MTTPARKLAPESIQPPQRALYVTRDLPPDDLETMFEVDESVNVESVIAWLENEEEGPTPWNASLS